MWRALSTLEAVHGYDAVRGLIRRRAERAIPPCAGAVANSPATGRASAPVDRDDLHRLGDSPESHGARLRLRVGGTLSDRRSARDDLSSLGEGRDPCGLVRPARGLVRVPDTPLVDLRTSMELPPADRAPGGP